MSINRVLVFIYKVSPLLASFEDYQELLIIRCIVSFSRNIFLAEVYHKIEHIVVPLQ